MVDLLNPEAHSAALSWIAAADAEAIAGHDFDGSKFATVKLKSGREIDVVVDVNDGVVTIDAWREMDAAWVCEHQGELVSEWDEREGEV